MSSTSTPIFNNNTTTLVNATDSGIRHSCYSGNNGLHYALAVFVIICGFTSNGFICLAFATKRKLRTVTNYFVVNLAAADFVLIFWWIVWMIVDFACAGTPTISPFIFTMEIVFASASVVGLAMVSFDRYYAVTRALHYNSTMTHSRALIAIICIWVYATIAALLFLGVLYSEDKLYQTEFAKYYSLALFVVNFLIPFFISMFCYISIFLIALSHLRHSAPAGQPTDPNSNAAIIFRQLKITFNIVILAAPFLIAWNFYYGITVYESFARQSVTQNAIAELVISNLPQLVATINPLIFICLTKDLRRFARHYCRCLCRRGVRHDRLTLTETYPNSTTQYTSNGDYVSSRV